MKATKVSVIQKALAEPHLVVKTKNKKPVVAVRAVQNGLEVKTQEGADWITTQFVTIRHTHHS